MTNFEAESSPSDYDLSPGQQQQRWGRELEAFKRRTRKFHKKGTRIDRRFKSEETDRETSSNESGVMFRLNLFNTNISTLQSMLFGSTPQTDVKRRFDDPDDDTARVAATMLNRILKTSIEAPGAEFSEIIKASLQDRLLPGIGTARVRYVLETETQQVDPILSEDGEELVPGYEEDITVYEDAIIDYVHWRDFAWGWSRIWKNVPWVAFRSNLRRDEMEKRFGEKKANSVQYTKQNPTGSKRNQEPYDRDQQDVWETAEIWEIWSKEDRKTYWFSSGAINILDEKPDPLKLPGFFPCPEPMAANVTTSHYMPKSDYSIAQDLYNEIDVLQTRIAMLTKAVKAVGVYDSKNEGLKRMLREGIENDLIPVDNWAMFAEGGGLKGVVDWMPIEDIANTLIKLRDIRDETIQLLYQVTGLSDILRGSSDQYSSAAAEKLKAKFASIRVQAIQDQFAKFASDLMTLKACVVVKHFSSETIANAANMRYSKDRDLVSSALKLMKEPRETAYRVEIRPETIAMVDYAQLKAERTEYLTALSTFLQSAQATIKVEPNAGPFLMELMKWGLAGFKGSDDIEGVVDRAIKAIEEAQKQKAAQPPEPSPEQQKQQMDMEKDQAKFQQDMMKIVKQSQEDLKKLMVQAGLDIKEDEAKTENRIREIRASGNDS